MIDLETYAHRIGIPVSDLISKSRETELVTARQVYWHLMMKNGYTHREAGKLFNRDHATVVHGINKINDLMSIGYSYLKRYLDAIDDKNEVMKQ